jgi:CysZ protein
VIFAAAAAAFGDLFRPEARWALLKTLGLTLLILFGAWYALDEAFTRFAMPWIGAGVDALPAWAEFLRPIAALVAGIALALALGFLLAPVTALVAGLFLDDVAEAVERADYPADPPGRALPFATSLALSLRFLLVVALANALALVLLLVPGVNLIAFLAVNSYLLGREFFTFAAMRLRTEDEARAMRRDHAGTVFLAGLAIALWLAVPVLNLTAPFFAAALMVHLHKALPEGRRV